MSFTAEAGSGWTRTSLGPGGGTPDMTGTAAAGGRRWFMRSATGAALAAVAMGAQALFGTAVASAQSTCCRLLATNTAWCPMLCAEQNQTLHCWACNNGQCKCCECSVGTSCFRGITFCAYQVGCCNSVA